jgi:hypothetical protein
MAKPRLETARVIQFDAARRERWRAGWRAFYLRDRQAALSAAGVWPPPAGADWCSDLYSPDYEFPDGSPPTPEEADAMVAETLRRSRAEQHPADSATTICGWKPDNGPSGGAA